MAATDIESRHKGRHVACRLFLLILVFLHGWAVAFPGKKTGLSTDPNSSVPALSCCKGNKDGVMLEGVSLTGRTLVPGREEKELAGKAAEIKRKYENKPQIDSICDKAADSNGCFGEKLR
ncbi:hypothetical protein BC829DRAFT_433812 [Chytridium lagenaria]|nr:hypothetical protein BC829DRAFT_433812 [Chytridium lagenaria]